MTVLTALAAVTTHLGLAGTLNGTFREPYELARQLATLDHLSGGRAAWNIVTSSDAFTGENFRRGGFLDYEDRYERAGEFIRTARELWDSWAADEIVADQDSRHVRAPRPARAPSPTTAPSSTSRATSTCPVARRSPGHPPGRRQRRGARAGRRHGRRHLQPPLDAGGRPGLLRRRQGAHGPLRPAARRAEDPARRVVRARRQRRGRRRAGATTSAASRSARRRRSCCSSSCGTATCRATTPRARCPRSIPTCRPTRSSRAAPACSPTR